MNSRKTHHPRNKLILHLAPTAHEKQNKQYGFSRPGQGIEPWPHWFKPRQRCTNLKPAQQLLTRAAEPPLDDILHFRPNSSSNLATVGLNQYMTSSLFHHQP